MAHKNVINFIYKMKGERGRRGFGREVYAVLQPAGGCRRSGTKMVEGIKTAVL